MLNSDYKNIYPCLGVKTTRRTVKEFTKESKILRPWIYFLIMLVRKSKLKFTIMKIPRREIIRKQSSQATPPNRETFGKKLESNRIVPPVCS